MISSFDGEYDAVGELEGRSPDQIRAADEWWRGHSRRWLQWDGDAVTAVATARTMPDARTFLHFAGDETARAALVRCAARHLGTALRVTVDGDDDADRQALETLGFETALTLDTFVVSFEAALARVRRAWLPDGYTILRASDVDRDRLFDLDNEVRNDVPGSDGWRGRRHWFEDELDEAPPFDPTAYLVLVRRTTDRYVGLVRFWRNPGGPRLGLVATVRDHRRAPFAAILLRRALEAASTWGSTTFVTEASTSNAVTHPALQRLGAQRVGRSHQLVRRP